MPRIAVVIGVSNYMHQPSLPACKNDADIVRFMLTKSNAFEDILFLSDAMTNSEEVKHQLAGFVTKHKGRADLDEIFFFYSGHGQFLNDEFYFLLSDFDEKRRNKTSLKNSELDGFLRTLKPALAVKVVDACNAGVQYVKDASGLSAIIEKGSKEQGLNKVYFMFSSLNDQSSFASTHLSDYTRSFVEAIYTSRRPEVRYRDIVDQIADHFENNGNQRPFFVIQADNTEVFGLFQEKEKNDIRAQLEAITAITSKATVNTLRPAKQLTIADLVKEQAKDYLSEKEMVEAIEQLKVAVSRYIPPLEFSDLFKVTMQESKDFLGLEGLQEIGKWLDDNKTEYLARSVARIEEYEDYSNSYIGILASLTDAPQKKVKKTRRVFSGYELLWDAPPFWRLGLCLNTQFPNVPTFKLNILYLFSRLEIRVFYSIDEKWLRPGDVRAQIVHGAWKALQLRLRELKESPGAIDPIFLDFTSFVSEKLMQIIGMPKEQLADANNTPTNAED